MLAHGVKWRAEEDRGLRVRAGKVRCFNAPCVFKWSVRCRMFCQKEEMMSVQVQSDYDCQEGFLHDVQLNAFRGNCVIAVLVC